MRSRVLLGAVLSCSPSPPSEFILELIGSPAAAALLRDWRSHVMPSTLARLAYHSERDRGGR